MPDCLRGPLDSEPPHYTGTVSRERLLAVVAAGRPRFLLVTAPGGYGKTVFASQLASSEHFEARLWLAASGLAPGETISDLFAVSTSKAAARSTSLLMPDSLDSYSEEAMSEVRAAVQGRRACVVIDGLDERQSVELLSELSEIDAGLGEGSLLVVTSRDSCAELRSGREDSWTLESRDLAFDPDEAAEVLARAGLDEADSDVAWYLSATAGHPALMAVVARHCALRGYSFAAVDSSPDLVSLIRSLVREHLTADEREVLWGAALLGSGSTETLQRVLGRPVSGLTRMGEVLPLVQVSRAPGQRHVFTVHDIARGVLLEGRSELVRASDKHARDTVLRACDVLAFERRSNELMSLLAAVCNEGDIATKLLQHGSLLLETGSTSQLDGLLETVDPAVLVGEPRLLLVAARLRREQRRISDALRLAASCAELAAHTEDKQLEGAALLVTARLRIDDGAVLDAEELLEALMARSEELQLTEDDVAFVNAYLMICRAYRADAIAADAVERRSRELLEDGTLTVTASSFLDFAQSAVAELVRGDYAEALRIYIRVGRTEGAPRAVRFHSTANAGLCMIRLGQLARAKERLEGMLEQSSGLELNLTHASAGHGLGLVDALQSRVDSGIARLDSAVESFRVNPFAHATGLCERSEVKRATSDMEGACADAEEALEVARGRPEMLSMVFMARAEWCAARFAAGDRAASIPEAQSLSDTLTTESHARPALLSAEAILASAAFEDGLFDEAAVRMAPYEAYIASESANLWLATWIRTFPAFLPVIAAAIGPDRLPSHMLRLIDEKSARDGLRQAWVHLARDQWETLAHRLLSDDGIAQLEAELREADSCRVCFFGGLEVQTPAGAVPDSRWRKRKARLLFAMLAVRRGQDVPRDVLLEYLWPEMDDERARNNFYVVWNALRSALDPDGSLGERCEYVESRGGICRCISECVRTDLDDFDMAAQQVREAEVAGDASAVGDALDDLASGYVGDLLPGDVYDDWFGEAREHYRQAFVDLVVRGSKMLRESGDEKRAIEALRSALVHDPVNEDAFRELLRCQIAGGQRTAAIETYMTCRERLAESLGLDPSEETSALYGDILAMEDGPVAGTGFDPGLSQGLA